MSAEYISYRGYRIKKSHDWPGRFWIVNEATGALVKTLEPSSFEGGKDWVDSILPEEESDAD